MIKVGHIITKLELGGAQQNTLHTVSSLDRQRFLPFLIAGSEGILVEAANRIEHVKKYYVPELVREIRPRQDMVAFQKIRTILRQEQHATPDMPYLVHTHSSKAGIVGRWAAKQAGIPYIIHSIHGFGFHPQQRPLVRQIFILLERLTARITTHFIAVSKANLDLGVQLRLFSRDQVSLIRSGIALEPFLALCNLPEAERRQRRAEKCRELRIPADRKIVGMIACFKPQKAPLDFVRVMRVVADAIPDAHAIMVGDGELRPQVEALIAELHVESVISLLGWRTDIPELLALCQVAALTSRWEGLPRVCPQAMAMGLPVVATAVDGTPEAVHDGVNGFLAPPGDVPRLSEKIIELLRDPALATRLGQQGQKLVQEFDIHRMVQQQEDLYERLVNGR